MDWTVWSGTVRTVCRLWTGQSELALSVHSVGCGLDRMGLDFWQRKGIFFLLQNIESGPASHLFSAYWGFFLWGWDLYWTTYLILVLRLGMSGAVPLPPHMLSWHSQGKFFVLFIFFLFTCSQFFKDTVTISNYIMSDSRSIVKCLWLYLTSIRAFVWVSRGAMQFLVQDNQCLDWNLKWVQSTKRECYSLCRDIIWR